ncbi:MAG: glycoside hydrolase family 28 protein [Betaproteobacteria bacterium]|nr:glycoside hydrolase family 28 protein [Betaproteobacteria bacterium]
MSSTSGIMANGWADYATVLARIRAPVFPERDFPITQFGAVADGASDATAAIAMAIATCHAAGGGRVLVPAGNFLTGPIVLQSRVNLHLAEGATLKFSTDPARYPTVFTRWEGIECMNYSPLIYAFEQEDIAITGKGTLDGQASEHNWWAWKKTQRADQAALVAMGEQGVPVSARVFGQGHLLRPNFVQPYRCRNILIEGIGIRNSPMWELHPVLSRNITVRGVRIDSHGPNNDGCDPESCHDVLIEGCRLNTGDDCIAIKSGRNNDGRRVNVASENIVVRGCRFEDGHGGVVLGSECSGHIRNVFIEDCDMDSPALDRALRFKNNAVRGGILENVFMRNVRIGRVGESVLTIDLLYEEGARGTHPAIVRNVQLENVSSTASPRVMHIAGYPGATIDRIKFSDCTFRGVESAEVVAGAGSIEFHNVVIEPRSKPASKSSRGAQ